MLKYTNRTQVGKAGSWPIVGIAWYEEIYKCVLDEREACATNNDDPCDQWIFDPGTEMDNSVADASGLHIDASIMILEMDTSQYHWDDDSEESDPDDLECIKPVLV